LIQQFQPLQHRHRQHLLNRRRQRFQDPVFQPPLILLMFRQIRHLNHQR
jgi:hypothetical protein